MNWDSSGIRWTDYTWNPVHGCSKTSEGCQNCYAKRVSHRFGHTDKPWTPDNADKNVTVKRHKLVDLDSVPDPCWVFVNSMSDLFHELVPPAFVGDVLGKICEHRRSAFQILTKHGADDERNIPLMPPNVMLGVSVESPRRTYRIDWLNEQEALTKFISFEPLVECIPPQELDLEDIDWAIVGGESGPEDDRREMDPAWARNLLRECWSQDVAVFFKQHSGPQPEDRITLAMGPDEEPRRIEEFPDLPGDIVPAPAEFLEVEA